jgi:hypothetical protein
MTLPPLTDMVRADEYTLSLDQELRLLDDRRKRSRWWIAPEGTPAPGPRIDDSRTIAPGPVLTEPWLSPWTQLNDPARDDMVGVVIVDEADPGQGILIWVHPTAEARAAWQAAWDDPTWREVRPARFRHSRLGGHERGLAAQRARSDQATDAPRGRW